MSRTRRRRLLLETLPGHMSCMTSPQACISRASACCAHTCAPRLPAFGGLPRMLRKRAADSARRARVARPRSRRCSTRGGSATKLREKRFDARLVLEERGERPRFAAVLVNYNAGARARARAAVDRRRAGRPRVGRRRRRQRVDRRQRARRWTRLRANVRLVRNDTNVGFARGVNQGLAATTAPPACSS